MSRDAKSGIDGYKIGLKLDMNTLKEIRINFVFPL